MDVLILVIFLICSSTEWKEYLWIYTSQKASCVHNMMQRLGDILLSEKHITEGEMLPNSRIVQGCSHADVTTGSGGPTEGGSGLGKPISMGAYWASQRRGYSRICVSNWTSSNKTWAFGLLLGQGYCTLVYQT